MRLCEITDQPIDVAAVLAHLDDDASGGVTIFVGRVRDHDGGRAVTALSYVAHPSAERRLAEVCEEVAASHGVRVLGAVHRVGDLAIGDIAVVVAASAAHRGDAFTATRALIDTLKDRVPIWKEQVFADGASEWVGTP